ncbi:hypothetical protein BpHYR1_046568 [Brachionus plicatilis]|uniref:SWIM-type domain-containing protein n=1 Tax=Brachionus plicatilis TaxID=10195 RepID=A0A3M7SB97_BRAPC|nr:hypothetical protein BpHYR1_046568 [Brachionus plicatilis]
MTSTKERNILKKRRGINREWIYVDMFDDNEAADLWLKNKTKWLKEDTYSTNDGDKIICRCNLVKRRGPQCDAKLMLLFNADNLKAKRFESGNHTPDKINEGVIKRGLVDETKKLIERYLDLKILMKSPKIGENQIR